MAGKATRFYLGRVLKQGTTLTERDGFVTALREAATVRDGDYLYTFIDIEEQEHDGRRFVTGRLAKFLPEGEIGVVETERHAGISTFVPNFLRAASRFVYVPEVAAIAYEHVWNEIENRRFEKIVPLLVHERYRDFFVWCSIEPITDIRKFIVRIAQMERVTRIYATVRPPNPLFSPLWKSLRDYIKQRRAREVAVQEQSDSKGGLKTDLPAIARATPEQGAIAVETVEKVVGRADLDITDAAVLYGRRRLWQGSCSWARGWEGRGCQNAREPNCL